MASPRSSQPCEAGARRPRLLGNEQPRIFTPPLRDLTPETTDGYACIEFAEAILEVNLWPWQKWVLLHALELNPDGTYRFRTVVLLVARQQGKSTLMLVLSLWAMYVQGAPLVIGTAQNLDIAEEQWAAATDMAEAVPELASLIKSVDRTNGKKALVLESGERYKVAAASRRGGRGLSGDLVLLDELREHQNWQAWGAVTKTTMARPRAQVWAASNAGDLTSVVLRHLRSLAHRALGWPDGQEGMADIGEVPEATDLEGGADQSLGLFEYSAAPGRGIWDRDGWAEANPSLGYMVPEAAIASAAGTDPEHVFRTEVLCQFVNHAATGPFPTGSWKASTVDRVTRDTKRPVEYAVDLDHDRVMAYIAIAFWDTLGRRRVEVAAQRVGTDWIIPWLTSPKRKVPVNRITLQTRGAPITSMLPAFEEAGIEVAPWEGVSLAGWHGTFYDFIRAAAADDADGDEVDVTKLPLTHGAQPALDVHAQSAVIKPLGDGWAIDRKNSPNGAAALVAAIAAVGQLETAPAVVASAYEDNDLMVV
ncbi:hypothetical protein OVA14_07170 [Agrococcus sp. SL85]|uniref:hypothetical protein n=1 Tax=Agrococcus sp. SL85 TaxID=2995141 RepID=UPI00226D0824|nr:hypothetical protein [Agrococcus sp. SL85]WAC65173.1 hypothetical protein OVA14_07170 [Agrococcus sp. SL85]